MTDYRCICCGREIKRPQWWVRITVSGEVVPRDAAVPDREDQGCFPIGPCCECGARYKGFAFRLESLETE